MHPNLRAICDMSIILGTIDCHLEEAIEDAEKQMYEAKTNEEAIVFVDEIIALKEQRSDVVKSSLELELLDKAKQ